jgi:1-acyl-sn-glycerol-3-phosphate acyltransferase
MIQLDSREYTQAMTKSAAHPSEISTSAKSTVPSPENSTTAKVAPVNSRVCHWLSPVLYTLGRRILMPFYFRKLTVIGQENLPKTGPVILAPTHRSRWDALMVPYAAGKDVSGRDLRFMVSEDEVKGIQGWFIRRMGGFSVNTKHPGVGTIRHSVELLRNGEVLVIFPEGNIFRNGNVQPLKPGMARIALQAEASKPEQGLKIVPISIHYSSPVPHWRCEATVKIGSPLTVANYCTKSTKKSAQQLTNDLEKAMKEVDGGRHQPIHCQS